MLPETHYKTPIIFNSTNDKRAYCCYDDVLLLPHMNKSFLSTLVRRWHLALQVAPLLIPILGVKLFFHWMEWEFLSVNPLFTSLVAATTFLMGFLITGVIADYKESEKIPTEIAASIEVLYDESYIIDKNKNSHVSRAFHGFLLDFTSKLNNWFYRKEKTKNVLEHISAMNEYFAEFETLTQANFVTRMKQEQNNLRKLITRIHTIRETTFVQSAYTIVEALSFFLIMGMIFLKLEPFYESVFFVALVSLIVLYMIFLIKDLDNPFDYMSHDETATEVSLKPVHDLELRLKEKILKKSELLNHLHAYT